MYDCTLADVRGLLYVGTLPSGIERAFEDKIKLC